MADIKKELDKIKSRISEADFLANKGMANEVGVHIFTYEPKDELIVRNYIERLTVERSDTYRIIVFDLYEVFLEILKDSRVLDRIADIEEKRGGEYLLTQLQKNASQDIFLERMKRVPHGKGDVIFITGVGKVYPFMRSHKILNKMQEPFATVPIVMFYPGSYDGQTLNLFAEFFDDNYYRAYNLINREK